MALMLLTNLGTDKATNERFIGKALLIPSLYMHFYIEHNFGHHLHAATQEDPATAIFNQTCVFVLVYICCSDNI